jgi:lipoyl(octanoyl) transferase
VLLQHGSLPLHDDQAAIPSLLRPPGPAAAPVAALVPLLGYEPAWEALVEALAAGWEETLGVRLVPGALTADEAARAQRRRARYEDPAWTWHGPLRPAPAAFAAGEGPSTSNPEGEG